MMTYNQDKETIKLKDAEIERLKAEFQKASEWNRFSEIQIKNLQNIVEAQNELLIRAAAALDGWTQNDVVAQPLIAELRKAAG